MKKVTVTMTMGSKLTLILATALSASKTSNSKKWGCAASWSGSSPSPLRAGHRLCAKRLWHIVLQSQADVQVDCFHPQMLEVVHRIKELEPLSRSSLLSSGAS